MYLIKDNAEDAQRLPLSILLEKIAGLERTDQGARWYVIRAQGYGADICAFEDELEHSKYIEMNSEKLIRVAKDPGQWFYDLVCRDYALSLNFGVLDSGALFIDGERGVISSVLECFEHVSEI